MSGSVEIPKDLKFKAWVLLVEGVDTDRAEDEVASVLSGLLSLPGIDGVNSEALATALNIGLDGAGKMSFPGGTLVKVICNAAGNADLLPSVAEVFVRQLLDLGASLSAEGSGMSPLGHLTDSVMKTEVHPGNLAGIARVLIERGDTGEGSIDVFVQAIGGEQSPDEGWSLLGKALTIQGQREMGKLLFVNLRAAELAKNTPSVHHVANHRRI